MTKLTLTLLAAALALCAAPSRARAVFTLTLTQTGTNVTLSGTGSFNTTGLTPTSSFSPTTGYLDANLGLALPGSGACTFYDVLTSPLTTFGTGSALSSTSTVTGQAGGIESSQNRLYTPGSYVSGTTFTNSATFANTSFASLGITPGTYVYTFNSGANADSVILNVGNVPEPSTWALVGLGVAGLGVATLRRRVRCA